MTNEELAAELAAIAGRLGDIANRLSAPRQAQAEATPAPKAEKPKALKLEDVRAVLTTLSSNKGASAVKALLKDFGAEKLSDIAVQDYPELLAKAEEMGR